MRFSLPLFLAPLLLLAACDSDGLGDAMTCNLQAGPDVSPLPLTVTYRAEKTGDAELFEIRYTGLLGEETVDDPSLPWSRTVQVGANAPFSMQADGEVTDGSLHISYEALGGAGSVNVTVTDDDDCERYVD